MVVTPALWGLRNAKRADKVKSGYLTPAFSGAEKRRNCYVTPAFSGAPNARSGDKIRSGYLTLAFSGAKKRAALIHDPCIPGVPYAKRGKHHKWLPKPCLLGGPRWGEIAT